MLKEFNELEKDIEKYLINKGTVEIVSKEEAKDDAFKELNSIFCYNLDNNGYLGNFKKILFGDNSIYVYDLTTTNKTKTIKTIAYVEKNSPKCFVSYSNYSDKDISYVEEVCTTYKEDKKHINSRIKLRTVKMNSNSITKFNVLDSRNDHYVRNDYSIYYKNDNVIGISVNDEEYFKENDSFYSRLDTALNDIASVSTKINNTINDCFSDEKDNLKEYKIKRKR